MGDTRDPPGKAALHPAEVAGTNALVLDTAEEMGPPIGFVPSDRASAVVHVYVVVSALDPSLETPITRKVAEGGNVKQFDAVVRNPKSIAHGPPGVFGPLLGNPRI